MAEVKEHSPIMIRALYRPEDLPSIVDIWLEASIKAHDFVPASFWEARVCDMRDTYLPTSDLYLAMEGQEVCGFYALINGELMALFVKPDKQGAGIGSKLLEHAKSKCRDLSLCVYKANTPSIHFYEKHGFTIEGEQIDEHTGELELVMCCHSAP